MHEIEQELKALETLLSQSQSAYPEIARTAVEARCEYDIAWAEAIDELDHRAVPEGGKKPTVAVLEAQATLMVKEQMFRARMAEAELDIAKKAIASIEARLSATQTRAKLAQIEMGLTR